MSTDLRCFYCRCPATRRHGAIGWCEFHYWRVPAAVGETDPPCPDCEPAEATA